MDAFKFIRSPTEWKYLTTPTKDFHHEMHICLILTSIALVTTIMICALLLFCIRRSAQYQTQHREQEEEETSCVEEHSIGIDSTTPMLYTRQSSYEDV